MIDHVGIYGSRVAEGLPAFNVGLVNVGTAAFRTEDTGPGSGKCSAFFHDVQFLSESHIFNARSTDSSLAFI